MEHTVQTIGGKAVDIYSLHTVVVGTGAAGFNAADTLFDLGQTDIAMVTNGINRGTSRNTGSDKQTYYKLSMWGQHADSVDQMAFELMGHGCMDGDVALCEAAMSPRCFLKLCNLGVEFPTNRYGEYIGYQTDHDTAARATSAGPYTSRDMTECLERSVQRKNIKIFDGYQIISVLVHKDEVRGLLTYSPTAAHPYALFNCKNVIYATGGPASIYAHSVYPESQMGATGVALEAGVVGANLPEWQFGLASLSPRWNVSGSYFQVMPRIISVDDRGEEREFVIEYYMSQKKKIDHALSVIFRKGYQWPFHVDKVNGSSIIDLLVYQETILKGRKVYLDFAHNPMHLKALPYNNLDEEALRYTLSTGIQFGTPVERLIYLNKPAYQHYLNYGVDLKKDLLEIGLCAQHNNGGLAVDMWWQSSVDGLFVCGEAAGTHGVARPGGSALNSGQVGSTRAAMYIHANRPQEPDCVRSLLGDCGEEIERKITMADTWQGNRDPRDVMEEARMRMSKAGGCLRDKDTIATAMRETNEVFRNLSTILAVHTAQDVSQAYYLYDILLCQLGYLTAMFNMSLHRDSRGSALYSRAQGTAPEGFPPMFNHLRDDVSHLLSVQEIRMNPKTYYFACRHRKIRDLPRGKEQFENLWRTYREDKNIHYQPHDNFQTLVQGWRFDIDGFDETVIPD